MARVTAREAVMQMVYENLAGGEGGEETLQMVYEVLRKEGVPGVEHIGSKEPGKDDRAYIERALAGVLEHLDEIDEKIAAHSRGWSIERMPMVDLTILRLAAWEILYSTDVPGNVAISEAVNLANRYTEPQGSRFINGVLGAILREKEAAPQ